MGAPTSWPVAGFHSPTVPSVSALASRLPSGLNATPYTPSRALPWMGPPKGCLLAVFHSRSREAECNREPDTGSTWHVQHRRSILSNPPQSRSRLRTGTRMPNKSNQPLPMSTLQGEHEAAEWPRRRIASVSEYTPILTIYLEREFDHGAHV